MRQLSHHNLTAIIRYGNAGKRQDCGSVAAQRNLLSESMEPKSPQTMMSDFPAL
jgi:hypothetical protein